jgi:hypothetical protein
MAMNPYESPAAVSRETPVTELRRPPMGTFLVGLWLLEGGVKALLVLVVVFRGFESFEILAIEYGAWRRVTYFLVSSFFIFETVGPWFGVYYLTGRRARTIPFDKALLRTLMTACGVAMLVTLFMMLYFEGSSANVVGN